jgi:NTP pyrophosphatase (non-canonical NTP hydrolase)
VNLEQFSKENLARCEAPNGFTHKINSWSTSDWMTACIGELGEAANIVKKLNRVRDGIPHNSETPEQLQSMLADEVADTVIYLDLHGFERDKRMRLPVAEALQVGGTWLDETRANAQLIAAAPELLDALVAVVAIADRATVEFDRARAAIAKAKGGAA